MTADVCCQQVPFASNVIVVIHLFRLPETEYRVESTQTTCIYVSFEKAREVERREENKLQLRERECCARGGLENGER